MNQNKQIFHALLNSGGYINLEYIEKHLEAGMSKDYGLIVKALLENSTLRIRKTDLEKLGLMPSTHPFGNIIHAQEVAKSKGSNIYIACMPKSGSSFFSASIETGLGCSFAHTTTSRETSPSVFGVNPREQEICEFAIIKKILSYNRNGIVAQHHTKASPYTAEILSAYNFQIIVLTKNLFDIIISADEMLQDYDMTEPANHSFNLLPLKFSSMEPQIRYELLAKSLGVWCIEFYLSWQRQKKLGTKFLEINYDTEISLNKGDKKLLAKKVAKFLKLSPSKTEKLTQAFTTKNFDKERARFNRGKTDQGKKISAKTKKFLIDYAEMFSSELNSGDFVKLFGSNI